ncbi:MAG: hypothetical protein GX614_05925 [Sandaracinaceae bacterium]|nr:hypothetical protein [Sandaracinaceae bacterium]
MRIALALALVLGLIACKSDEPVRVSEGLPRAYLEEPPAPAPSAHPYYDESGSLRESDEVIAGLRLPVGMTLHFKEDRRHVYNSHLPPRDFVRYFGPRLFTGDVRLVGEGAVYRDAAPMQAKGAIVKLEVAIRETARGSQVDIREIPPPPLNPKSAAELSELLKAEAYE